MKIVNLLYKLACKANFIKKIFKGPAAFVKYLGRKSILKKIFKLFN
ncbi:hypothetical protein JCM15060_09790 [Halanaerobaculum tunisiense]